MGLSSRRSRQVVPDGWAAKVGGALATALLDTAELQAPTRTVDDTGGEAWTYTSQGTVACRLVDQQADTEATVQGRVDEDQLWWLLLPNGTTIDTTWRVILGGATYEVQAVRGGSPEPYTVADVRRT